MASILSSGRGEVYIGFSIACEDNGISSITTVEDVIARGTLKSVMSLIAGEGVITGSANIVLRTHWLFAMADLSLERASSSFLSLI